MLSLLLSKDYIEVDRQFVISFKIQLSHSGMW